MEILEKRGRGIQNRNHIYQLQQSVLTNEKLKEEKKENKD